MCVNCSKIIDQSDVKKYRRREYFKSTGENTSQWPYVLTEDSTDRQNSVGEFYNINQNSFISIGHLAVLKFVHFKMPGFLNVNMNNNNTLF